MIKPCPFCTMPTERIIDSNEFGMTIRDGFPISPGHTLLIPKRHIGSWCEISKDEQSGLLALLERAKTDIQIEFSPDGYNIGINDGSAAGQTVTMTQVLNKNTKQTSSPKRSQKSTYSACTLLEVADMLGLTRERVRQIEAKALTKIRRHLETKDLKSSDLLNG